jgi:Leucine-rich repeat (LRR) protein
MRLSYSHLVLFLLLSFAFNKIQAQDRTNDSLALVALYNSTNGYTWSNITWDLQLNLENWDGVTLKNGRVDKLEIATNNLDGTLPGELGNLTAMTKLEIYGNHKLTGSLPPGLFNATNLHTLDLHWNKLSGEIPPEIGNLTKLVNLYLQQNQFSGSLPIEIANCQKLGVLGLRSNKLTSIPDFNTPELRIPKLWIVYFNSNELTDLPDLSEWPKLTRLSVQDNRLTFDDISPFIDNAADYPNLDSDYFFYKSQKNFTNDEIRHIEMGLNHTLDFDFSEPNTSYQWYFEDEAIAENGNTKQYLIENADFSDVGEYYCQVNHSDFPGMSIKTGNFNIDLNFDYRERDSLALVALYNSTNGYAWSNITWDLQLNLENWDGVTLKNGRVDKLEIATNNLDGTLPGELGNLTAMTKLEIYGNHKLTGSLPPGLFNATNLHTLDLHWNKLSGEIPPEIGNLTKLVNLYLHQNEFSGALPIEISECKNLGVLGLRANRITFVPNFNTPELEIPKLWIAYLNDNELTDLPNLSAWPKLTRLSVQDNRLTFDDIIPYIDDPRLSIFNYAPQDSVGEYSDMVVAEWDTLSIQSPVADSGAVYQWFKDGDPLPVGSVNPLVINNPISLDAGSYNCHITHPDVAGLTLKSKHTAVTVIDGRAADSLALVAIRDSLGNTDQWEWTPDKQISQWNGVELQNNRVSELSLRDGSEPVSGSIPDKLGNLSNLKLLIIEGPNFGTLGLPESIGKLQNLEILYIYTGSSGVKHLPQSLNQLANLKEIYYYADLDTLYWSLFSAPKLDIVILSSDEIRSIIVDETITVSNVSELIISADNLQELPDDFSGFTNLESLNLRAENLTMLPASINDLKALSSLWISASNLAAFPFPEDNALPNLVRLFLRSNVLTTLSNDVANYSNLQILLLRCKKLQGLPDSLNQLTKLYSFDFTGNQVISHFPEVIGSLEQVEYLWINSNDSLVSLPDTLNNMTNLKQISIKSNPNLAFLPSSVNQLTALSSFHVQYNAIKSLPADLGLFQNLTSIYLYSNQIEDLPLTLDANDTLKYFHAYSNNLTFGDLEPYHYIEQYSDDYYDHFVYSPQAVINLDTTYFEVAEGASINLEVITDGDSTKYQWFKNETAITGAIHWQYEISSAAMDDAGQYHCEMTNTLLPELALKTVKITVDVVPAVLAKTDPVSIRFDGKAMPIKPVLNTIDLWKDHSDDSDLAYYRHSLARLQQREAKANTVEMEFNATIRERLLERIKDKAEATGSVDQSKTLDQGEHILLRAAMHNPEYHYQWYKDGNKIDGAILNELMITAGAASQSGQYYCEISHSEYEWDTEISAFADISVNISENVQTLVHSNEQLPGQFKLQQNYPNPFNPSTTIRYDLPSDSNVKLQIFNSAGQLVTTLVNGYEAAGYRSAQWNGRNRYGNAVASGVYFYRIEAGSFVKSRKMLLLK